MASRIDLEGRRKKEVIEQLVNELVHAPTNHMPSFLRTAVERGWRGDLQQSLEAFETKMTAEISRVCNRHYAEFIASVEELMKMRADLMGLRRHVVALNSEVQQTGRIALTTAKTLLHQRHTAQNINAALRVISQCDEIVNMVMDAFVHIHDEKYYSALNTMDEIQQRLDGLGGILFAAQLRQWMPSLTDTINKATKEEMSEWLVEIRDVSYKVGGAAMRRYALLQSARTNLHQTAEDEIVLVSSQCERFLHRMEEQLGCSLRVTESEFEAWVPDFMLGGDSELVREQEQMLDHLSDYLHPVHRALHIFARLHMLDDFSTWYRDNRLPMAELRSMITRELDHLDLEGFLKYLPTLANGIAGFFIVEKTLMVKVDHKEGLLSSAQLEAAWEKCAVSLAAHVDAHVSRLRVVGHFVQIKETLLTLGSIMEDLEMDATILNPTLKRLVDPFYALQVREFDRTCRALLKDEAYQPLDVPDRTFYDAIILPLGLQEQGPGVDSLGEDVVDVTYADVIDDSYYFQESKVLRFPQVCPFSRTVPELGFALLKLAGMVISFLTHLDIPSKASMGFKALEQGAGMIRQLMMEQVQTAELDTHILKTSQISVNCSYLSRLPLSLANTLWDCLAALHLTGAAGPSSSSESSFQALGKSAKGLDIISDRARDLIFELVRRKADELLAGMEFVKWDPITMLRQPHAYADDLVTYLRVTFMNLSNLPSSMREAAHFTCMAHISSAILNHVIGPQVPSVNILGIKNLSLDLLLLMNFADESGINGLRECFANSWQLVDIVLAVDDAAMRDPTRRREMYPRLDDEHLIRLLQKYKQLGWGTKIKSTVGDIQELEQKQVQQLLKALQREK